jgi:hypothetical protein
MLREFPWDFAQETAVEKESTHLEFVILFSSYYLNLSSIITLTEWIS